MSIEQSPRVLGVDGNSMVHRAWHGGTDEFVPGWVSARVVGMLALAWAEGPYDAVFVAFDGEDNVRKERFPGYKANRAEKDPDLVEAIARAQVDLAQCGFPVDCQTGIEADDLLAELAEVTAAADVPCDILSSDRDLLALVGPTVRMLRPRGGLRDLQPYDEARVKAEFGVTPAQYRHLAALRGDPSDGLDGVRGIGSRAASTLVRRYETVAGVYEAVQWLAPKQEAALRAGRDAAFRNLELMTPLPGLTVDLDWVLGVGVDPVTIDAHLVPLGHGWAAGRMRHAIERGPVEPSAPLPDDEYAPFDDADRHDPLAGRPVEVGMVEADQGALF